MEFPDNLEHVAAQLENGVLRIALNRPSLLNSFTAGMHAELRAVLALAATPGGEVRCVLLTGTGRAFSAGQDLAEFDLNRRPLSSPSSNSAWCWMPAAPGFCLG